MNDSVHSVRSVSHFSCVSQSFGQSVWLFFLGVISPKVTWPSRLLFLVSASCSVIPFYWGAGKYIGWGIFLGGSIFYLLVIVFTRAGDDWGRHARGTFWFGGWVTEYTTVEHFWARIFFLEIDRGGQIGIFILECIYYVCLFSLKILYKLDNNRCKEEDNFWC